MYAIRKAVKWAVVKKDKLPSVAAFIADVRLAMGPEVFEKSDLLAKLMA